MESTTGFIFVGFMTVCLTNAFCCAPTFRSISDFTRWDTNFPRPVSRCSRYVSSTAGEVEMRDAEVEGLAAQRLIRLMRRVVAEIVPQAERDRRQLEAGPAASHRL